MTRDRCQENKERGYRFCPSCGNPLDCDCVYCAEHRARGDKFCTVCGRPLNGAPAGTESRNPLRLAAIATMPLIAVLFALEIFCMLAGAPSTWTWLAGSEHPVYVIAPVLMTAGVLKGLGLQISWVLIIVAVLASFALMMYQSRSMFRPETAKDVDSAKRTPLYWICLLFAPTIILNLIVMLAQAMFGHPLEVPDGILDMDIEDTLYSMANAAVWEEVITRLVYIGIPMAVVAAAYRKRDCLRYLLGGFGMSRLALVLIIISSILFGYAHSGGWGLEKVVPSAIAGLAMGYLFVRFGIHASIMFHFLTDYMAVVTASAFAGLASILFLAILAVGFVCLLVLIRNVYDGVRNVKDLPATGFEAGRGRE